MKGNESLFMSEEKKEEKQAEKSAQEAPKQEAPKAETPKVEAQKQETPKQEAPKAEAPKTETPKTEAPKQDAPKQEAPKAEAPKTEAPKAEEKKKEKPANCAVCNKSIKKKRYYYRDGKYYCTKRCWKTTQKKESKEAKEISPQQRAGNSASGASEKPADMSAEAQKVKVEKPAGPEAKK